MLLVGYGNSKLLQNSFLFLYLSLPGVVVFYISELYMNVSSGTTVRKGEREREREHSKPRPGRKQKVYSGVFPTYRLSLSVPQSGRAGADEKVALLTAIRSLSRVRGPALMENVNI